MTIAILATGDEIVHGDTLNTNAYQIAQTLSSEGLPLGFHLTCSDKEKDIINALNFLCQDHDMIIIIGGLGPTTDDLTRFALAKFTNEPLIERQEALAHIKTLLKNIKVNLNPGNLQQCLFPKSADILPNPFGSATGCFYQWNNKTFILLPGPPRECLPMFHQHVMPKLAQASRSTKHILKWRIFGLPESEIAHTLEEALKGVACQTGYRLETPYVEFKVRCTKAHIDAVKAIVDPILKPHIIATPEKKASEALVDLILKLNKPFSIIDEATGGLLQTLILKPELSNLVYFHKVDHTTLHFHLSGLEEYWSQKGPLGSSHLLIHYTNQNEEGGEKHEIPYRNPMVLNYAAEFLSFRLFHLLNHLH